MKKIISLFVSILLSGVAYAQNLPMKQVVNHLITTGEISPQKKWQNALSEVRVSKIFGFNNVALYQFSNTAVHRYNFLLVKNSDSFQILNCENFIAEYEIMERTYINNAKDSLYYYLIPIIGLYQHNFNYHKTPPIPDLTNRNKEPRYLPRKVDKTQPFFFKEQ